MEKQDFLDAVDRIIGGLEKKSKITTEAERRAIALHEAGHASLSWVLEHANPLIKVTIVPRGRALGAAWYLCETCGDFVYSVCTECRAEAAALGDRVTEPERVRVMA